MIRDILIARYPHLTLQIRLLESQKLLTEDAMKIWESYLQLRTQSQKLQELNLKEKDPGPETEETDVIQETFNQMRGKYQAPPKPYTERNHQHPSMKNHPVCSRCGRKGHNFYACTATEGQTCHKCGGRNHFARACRSTQIRQPPTSLGTKRKVNHLQEEHKENRDKEEEYEELVFSTRSKKLFSKKFKQGLTDISIEDVKMKVLINTGASVAVI